MIAGESFKKLSISDR